ncbi:hypothetical protein [Devosia aquimaris]|uniref:hypothetical protein n=1 Tax=Devosia aquimaris TaxID=2866214 RepID=UPI001CD05FC2|nr:hypothetical protein [Devosia sp. CJK-A8-3]
MTCTESDVIPAARRPALWLEWVSVGWRAALLRKRRRQATIDLIHGSPHLLRDIGLETGAAVTRDQQAACPWR